MIVVCRKVQIHGDRRQSRTVLANFVMCCPTGRRHLPGVSPPESAEGEDCCMAGLRNYALNSFIFVKNAWIPLARCCICYRCQLYLTQCSCLLMTHLVWLKYQVFLFIVVFAAGYFTIQNKFLNHTFWCYKLICGADCSFDLDAN